MAKRSKVKYKLDELLSDAFEMPEDRKELLSIYHQMAHTADTRLARLEEYASEENYKNATQWAYAKAERFIKEWSGPNATRFETKAPESDTQLKQKIEDIRTFLNAPSSTKLGIRSIHKKRADTLNERYGTNFKWDEAATFFESDFKNKLRDKIAGSETMIRVVARIQKDKKKVLKAIEQANVKDIKAPNDMVGKLVEMAVSDLGPEIKEYFSNTK